MKKKLLVILGLAVMSLFLFAGCGSDDAATGDADVNPNFDENTITICTMEEFYFKDIVEVAAEVLEDQGYTVEITTIADNVTPNVAVAEGSIEYSFFEHVPFLDAFNASEQGGNLVAIGEPITAAEEGLYSNVYSSIEEIEDGATVAIPNDTSNRTMHLRFMESLGLITLPEGKDTVNVTDIIDNPKNLQFIEMDTPNIVGSLDDVDLGTCSQSSIVKRGIDPTTALETYIDPSLGIVLVTTAGNENTQKSQDLYAAFTSQAVRDFLDNNYSNVVRPLF